jgi:replicative DNA helicase
MNTEAEAAYVTAVQTLVAGLAGWSGDPLVLQLDPAAHEAVIDIERAVEPTLVGDGELAPLADWGGKYVGAVVRIAGNLHLALHGSGGFRRPIDKETVDKAAQIGEYFKGCAINTFAEMATDAATADAVYLLERMHGTGAEELSERDIFNLSRRRFNTTADLAPVIERLVAYGWLSELPHPAPTGGRPASPRYRLVYAKAAQAAKGAL